jgi:hypothetical protein
MTIIQAGAENGGKISRENAFAVSTLALDWLMSKVETGTTEAALPLG